MNRPDDIYSENQIPPLARKGRQRRGKHRSISSGSDHERIGSAHEEHRPRMRRRANPIRHDTGIILLAILLMLLAVYLVVLFRSLRHPQAPAPTSPQKLEAAPQSEPPSDSFSLDQSSSERIQKLKTVMEQHRQAIARAYEHIQADRRAEAQERVDAALLLLPDSTSARKAQAEVFLASKDYTRAIPLLLDVLERDPDDLGSKLALAGALIAGRHDSAARAITDWILATQPYSIEARHLAAVACLNLNDVNPAILHLKKIMEIDASYKAAQNLLVIAYRRQGDTDSVIKLSKDQLAAGNQDAIAHFNLAACHAIRNEPEEAVAWLRRARELFGTAFVKNWLVNPDFDAIRQTPVFADFMQQMGVNL